jgi:hypothetical protein
MGHYDLLYRCDACHRTHPMGVDIELSGGPRRRTNLRTYTAGKYPPRPIVEFIGCPVWCPQTGKPIVTKDFSRIYLEPL